MSKRTSKFPDLPEERNGGYPSSNVVEEVWNQKLICLIIGFSSEAQRFAQHHAFTGSLSEGDDFFSASPKKGVLHVGVALSQEFFGYSKVWASLVFSCCLNESDRFKSRFCCLKPNSVCLIRSFARIPFIRFFDRCGDNSISSSLMRKISTYS